MTNGGSQAKELKQKIAQLESQIALLVQRLSELEKKVERRSASSVAFNQALMDERAVQASRLDDAFERIKGLEVSVFPNLLKDIHKVHQIIGGDGIQAKPNPLDIRKPDAT